MQTQKGINHGVLGQESKQPGQIETQPPWLSARNFLSLGVEFVFHQ